MIYGTPQNLEPSRVPVCAWWVEISFHFKLAHKSAHFACAYFNQQTVEQENKMLYILTEKCTWRTVKLSWCTCLGVPVPAVLSPSSALQQRADTPKHTLFYKSKPKEKKKKFYYKVWYLMFTSLSAVRLLLAKKRCILLLLYLSYSKKKTKKNIMHSMCIYFPWYWKL